MEYENITSSETTDTDQGNGESFGVGAMLRASRLRIGEDLHNVSEMLCIRYPYLDAIEEGQFGELPGATYAVGFIRTYADHLGIDSDEMVRRYKVEVSSGGRDDLDFPTPVSETGIPGGAIIFVGLVAAAVAYGGWYSTTTKDGFLAELISPAPDQIAAAPEQDSESASGNQSETAPETAVTETAETSMPSEVAAETVEQAAAAETQAEPLTEMESSSDEAAQTEPVEQAEAPAESSSPEPEPEQAAEPEQTAEPEPEPEQPAQAEASAAEPAALEPEAETSASAAETGTPVATPEPAADAVAEAAPEPVAEPVAETETASTETASAETETEAAPDPAPETPAPELTPDETVSQPEPVVEAESPAAPVEEAAAPVVDQPAPEAATATEEVAPPVSRIVIVAKSHSWLQVRDDIGNEMLVTRLLRTGDRYEVPDQPGLRLSTGNAGALEILVDGEVVPPIGPEGSVRRDVVLDPEKLRAGTAVGN